MIIYGLHKYLTDPASVDNTSFSNRGTSEAQEGLGVTLKNRDDARRELQGRIGQDVYWGRKPGGIKPAYMVLDVVADSSQSVTSGVTGSNEALVQIDCFTNGHQASQRNEVLAFLVRMACDGFRGKKWGDYFVGSCVLQNIASDQLEPIGAKGKWTFVTSLDFNVSYKTPSPIF